MEGNYQKKDLESIDSRRERDHGRFCHKGQSSSARE